MNRWLPTKDKIAIIILSFIIGLSFGFAIGFWSGMTTLEKMISFPEQTSRPMNGIAF